MNPIELHVAGATVTHKSPFSHLPVSVNATPLTTEIRETWVRPLYIGLRKPHIKQFIDSHLHLADDKLVSQLLASFDWRPRSAAAYLVALTDRKSFTTHIGQLLLRSDVCFAGSAYCLALAEFNSPEATAFLDEYLTYYLSREDLWFDQAAAMGALSYLDRLNGTDIQSRHIAAWDKFVEHKSNWNLAKSTAMFEESIATLHSLKSES
jgi:Family of unknown function (DUF6000)